MDGGGSRREGGKGGKAGKIRKDLWGRSFWRVKQGMVSFSCFYSKGIKRTSQARAQGCQFGVPVSPLVFTIGRF